MSAQALEALLAALYSKPALLEEFLANPRMVAVREGLSAAQADDLAKSDPASLRLAAHSFARKRASHAGKKKA